ncbi:MAG TPA: hypothetical protein ENI70_00660 [Candidatus Peregrinibacteria bacterium]|nr:hypothetical protein [Candidatus Peregrinibacteria bacterium]
MPPENPQSTPEKTPEIKKFDPIKCTEEFLEKHGESQVRVCKIMILPAMRRAKTLQEWEMFAEAYKKFNDRGTGQKRVDEWKQRQKEKGLKGASSE